MGTRWTGNLPIPFLYLAAIIIASFTQDFWNDPNHHPVVYLEGNPLLLRSDRKLTERTSEMAQDWTSSG